MTAAQQPIILAEQRAPAGEPGQQALQIKSGNDFPVMWAWGALSGAAIVLALWWVLDGLRLADACRPLVWAMEMAR